jgi:hypothetical protein
MKAMKIDKVIELLEKHNAWRRDQDGVIPMQDTKEIGEAIDEALKILKAYRNAMKTIETYAKTGIVQ